MTIRRQWLWNTANLGQFWTNSLGMKAQILINQILFYINGFLNPEICCSTPTFHEKLNNVHFNPINLVKTTLFLTVIWITLFMLFWQALKIISTCTFVSALHIKMHFSQWPIFSIIFSSMNSFMDPLFLLGSSQLPSSLKPSIQADNQGWQCKANSNGVLKFLNYFPFIVLQLPLFPLAMSIL